MNTKVTFEEEFIKSKRKKGSSRVLLLPRSCHSRLRLRRWGVPPQASELLPTGQEASAHAHSVLLSPVGFFVCFVFCFAVFP